ncbi:hypothetical protein VTO58DRAFT_108617 [Aureobasidium pullulans]|nr:hypothetical protein JADG_005505 [Aureobasidium pullulans]KAG2165768.1 hypothetical protein JADG_005507 [Aureobasidium pullulans]
MASQGSSDEIEYRKGLDSIKYRKELVLTLGVVAEGLKLNRMLLDKMRQIEDVIEEGKTPSGDIDKINAIAGYDGEELQRIAETITRDDLYEKLRDAYMATLEPDMTEARKAAVTKQALDTMRFIRKACKTPALMGSSEHQRETSN